MNAQRDQINFVAAAEKLSEARRAAWAEYNKAVGDALAELKAAPAGTPWDEYCAAKSAALAQYVAACNAAAVEYKAATQQG
jgi:hypothetical protein